MSIEIEYKNGRGVTPLCKIPPGESFMVGGMVFIRCKCLPDRIYPRPGCTLASRVGDGGVFEFEMNQEVVQVDIHVEVRYR